MITNQPVDPQLWDSNFCPISLFGIDEYLEDNTKNITCSPLKIMAFIRQHKLENKTAEDILQISEFEFVAWNFLSSIYKSGWDKLTANKDNRSFRQCISFQFNVKTMKNTTYNNLAKRKQANILRVPLSIFLRPSKSILVKPKFFKKNLTSDSTSKSNK